MNNLSDDKFNLLDVGIAKTGEWYCCGEKISPRNILERVDVVVNAMHGEYGEDGKVQRILDRFRVPYTGSRTIPSALAMNKALAKNEFRKKKIKTPIDLVLQKEDEYRVAEIFQTFPMPAIVKPVKAGSSVGIGIAQNAQELAETLERAFEISDKVLVEELIEGREATCGVVDNFRGQAVYALLPIEIRSKSQQGFFDYEAKYGGQSEEICPGNFTAEEKSQLQELAKQAHQALGLRHYSRSDFIIHPRRGIYLLETNSLPGLTAESLLPKSLQAIGCSLSEFLEHLIDLAENKG